MGFLRRELAILLLVSLGVGCATDRRFVRHRVQVSPLCVLVLIHDLRSDVCLASYQCGARAPSGLIVVPSTVCAP